jgi:hypothetical protein
MRLTPLATLLLACIGAAWAGGTVNVSFIEPERFSDAGERSYYYSPATLQKVEQYLQHLGQRYLPDGQALKVEVTDIDLAGELRPVPGRGDWVRIARGKADWPRFKLRYTLEAGGQPVKQGEETLANLDYMHVLPDIGSYEPMRYERLLLEAWFKARFTAAH